MTNHVRKLIASALATTILAGVGSGVQAKELKFSLLLPEHHILVQRVFKPFEEEVEAKSNGELEITLYPSAVLGDGKEQLRLTETGVADIALVVPSYTRGRFPLLETGTLPFAFDSAVHGTKALASLQKDYIEPEFDSVKLLYAAMTSPTAILTVDEPLKSLGDIKGLSLRGTGGEQNEVLEALGANLVSVPASDIYVAMERGTIGGTILSLASAPGYKLEEVVKYVNQVNFSSTPITVVMNRRSWDALTPEQQEVIAEASRNAAVATGEAYDAADQEGLEKLEAQGAEIVNFSDADMAELKKITEPSWETWTTKLNDDGKNGDAFMAAFRESVESTR